MPTLFCLPEAQADINRLLEKIGQDRTEIVDVAAKSIGRALDFLAAAPELGRPMLDGTGRFEVPAGFGNDNFMLRYRIEGQDSVILIRVWLKLFDEPTVF